MLSISRHMILLRHFHINIIIFAKMCLKLRKSLSIFILTVFLLQMIAAQVHAFGHRHDKHCTNTKTHFCTHEQHCKLCDFVLLVSDVPVAEFQLKLILFYQDPISDVQQRAIVTQYNAVYPLRGPPTVS